MSEKSMTDNYKDLQALIECLNLDFEKFNTKKVKAAGQRSRNSLLNCKKLCDTIRKQILSDMKQLPIRHRTKIEPETPATPATSPKPEPEIPEPEPAPQPTPEQVPESEPAPVSEPVKPKKKRKRKDKKKEE